MTTGTKNGCDAHTPQPDGYLEWHEWAAKMSVKYKQIRCPGCGLFKIWVLK